jgi:hypothetical protein
MWRITPQVVVRYRDISNFKATGHTMWLQARNHPDKKWLQMRYCITKGDIDMVISEWDDKWKILVLTEDLLDRITE